VDNDLQDLETCTVGQGVCEMTAPVECQDGTPVCTAVEGTPDETPEVSCGDGRDNDCDGLIDQQDTTDCPVSCETFPPDINEIPDGTYLSSCFDCSLSGSELGCSCFNEFNESFFTTLELTGCDSSKDIRNQQGILACTPC